MQSTFAGLEASLFGWAVVDADVVYPVWWRLYAPQKSTHLDRSLGLDQAIDVGTKPPCQTSSRALFVLQACGTEGVPD